MKNDKDIGPTNKIKKIDEINTDGLKWTLSLLSGGRTWYLKTKNDLVAILHGRNLFDTTMIGQRENYINYLIKNIVIIILSTKS